MKIDLEISGLYLFKTFYVSNKLSLGPITFCIDTGSNISFISLSDAKRLNARVSHLPEDPIPTYAGGGFLPLRVIGKAILKFVKGGR